MVDRTKEWQEVLRAARPPGSSKPVSSIIPKKQAPEGSVSAAAKAVMDGIVKTQRMLWEQEGAYTALRGGLSDEERNSIDVTVRKFIGDCGERIDEFKEMARTAFANDGTDQKAHCKGMVLMLLEELDAVSVAFQKLKAFRMQQFMEHGNRLQPLSSSSKSKSAGGLPPDPPQGAVADIDGLTAEEERELLEENELLHSELQDKLENLIRMEKELTKITAMSELTASKIEEQAAEIDSLYDTVVESVANIDAGNVQLQKAADASSSSRLFMLLFLLIASATLLFLHWFMD
mmetsp:Transcript_58808/g.138632  ORF Transcript_58808/g.138632 Transcript_58808/m.138632 type:complete len:290 (-) Transcript_58808:124-993(-)